MAGEGQGDEMVDWGNGGRKDAQVGRVDPGWVNL